MIDHGQGYLRSRKPEDREVYRQALKLCMEHYRPEDLPDVLERATTITSAGRLGRGDVPHQSSFALLHRILEETGSGQEILDSLPEDLRELVIAANKRDGESSRQTAIRAVRNPHLPTLLTEIGGGYHLWNKPAAESAWWPTNPEAWSLLDAESTRAKEQRQLDEDQVKHHYSLPTGLKEAGVPAPWANAVRDAYRDLVGEDSRYRTSPRARRIDRVKHLRECWESGMSPELYQSYVRETSLSWTEFPVAGALGLNAEQANSFRSRFDSKPGSLKLAAQLAGGSIDAGLTLGSWSLTRAGLGRREGEDYSYKSRVGIGWHRGGRPDNGLNTLKRVKAAWEVLCEDQGGEDGARRFLAIYEALPVPHPAGRTRGLDHAGHLEMASAWSRTPWSVERILLLVGAGITVPGDVDEETAALSDEQLGMVAALASM